MTTYTAPTTPSTLSTPVGPRPAARYAVEAVGTFFLVLTIGAVVTSHHALAPLAIGATLMAMVYAGGHLSGGHYNPAVTLAVLVRGRIGRRDAAAYWLAQTVGAALAALVVRTILAPDQVAATTPLAPSAAAFAAELLFTFALCYVVLNVATSKDHPDNSFYGLAIGFTVAAGAIAVGSVSGAAFNPAVTVAAVLMGLFAWPTLGIYLVAQLLGGLGAGAAFLALNRGDR